MITYQLIRRGFEFSGATVACLLVFPILLIAILIIWLEDRDTSPILRQRRLGLHEVPFSLLKLRTMRGARFDGTRKLTDAERMLRAGRILRKLSIDELPQLVNVLRGEMSFIGPRPMPIVYQPYFRPEERIRHSVRPGMSGLAQIKGRNFLSWDDKFALDIEFVRNFGFVQDVKIFFLTLWKLAVPSGVGTRGDDLPTQSLHEIREPWQDVAGD